MYNYALKNVSSGKQTLGSALELMQFGEAQSLWRAEVKGNFEPNIGEILVGLSPFIATLEGGNNASVFKTLPEAQRTQKLTPWLGINLATTRHHLH